MWITRKKIKYGVFGDYPSWEDALANSQPYETDLAIYGALSDGIRRGQARFGRHPLPVLGALSLVPNAARVLDFGGNLGMQYFEINRLIPDRIHYWRIVDQRPVVDFGNQSFADEKLAFFETITDAISSQPPNVLIASHTLQYLKEPYAVLENLLESAPSVLVLHEVPIGPRRRFMVQRVPAELGGGSHPAQLLTETELAAATKGYDMVTEMTLPDWAKAAQTRQVARIYRRNFARDA